MFGNQITAVKQLQKSTIEVGHRQLLTPMQIFIILDFMALNYLQEQTEEYMFQKTMALTLQI